MSTWFTADHHFSHANVIKYSNRPFASVEEMDEAMVQRYNSVVADDDLVYVLGDFSMSGSHIWRARQLKGRKILVPGNHDKCHQRFKRWHESEKMYTRAGFEQVLHGTVRCILSNGMDVYLNHFPYDNKDERFQQYLPHDDGETYLLHGHVHTAFKARGRQLNVGVDVYDFFPVHESAIIDAISS